MLLYPFCFTYESPREIYIREGGKTIRTKGQKRVPDALELELIAYNYLMLVLGLEHRSLRKSRVRLSIETTLQSLYIGFSH